jgi:hypothetical protein
MKHYINQIKLLSVHLDYPLSNTVIIEYIVENKTRSTLIADKYYDQKYVLWLT